MLRIIVSKSAAAAMKYYTEGLTREDYYSQGQEVVGKWHGKAAARMGLSGNVAREQFAALVTNKHPTTGEKLTPRMKADRRVAYDLNFHVPKSVSLLYAFSKDERILNAFRSAVAETMSEIETLVATRVRKGGAQNERITGNFAWAEFVHFTARPVGGVPDPLLHIHAFAFNSTFDTVENRWKAVSWAAIKKDAPYSEAVFHSRLAGKLAEFGYGIERTKTGWEIAGVPRTLVEKFSRRTAQIEALAAEKGISDAKVKDALGAATREGKRHGITDVDLLKEWRSRLTPAEERLISDLASGLARPRSPTRISPRLALDEACEKVFAKASVVDTRRLLGEALRFGVGHITPEQVWAEFKRRGMVEREVNGESLCTSVDVLAEEISLIHFVREGRGMCAPLGRRDFQTVDKRLSAEQLAAVQHILTCPDQVLGVRGLAGTGKTTAMVEAVKQIELNGLRVFPFAPSATASRETLREAGFANAETVAHLLMNTRLQEQLRGHVIWIDEAGQIGSHDMLEILRIAGMSTRVILTGDVGQHAPVPRGDSLRMLQHYAGLRVAEITEIRRQEPEVYRKAVAALAAGDLRTAFRRLDEMGGILEIENDAERYRLLAHDYLALSTKSSVPLVISPTHAEGAAVTNAIRDAKREAGKLGPEKTFVSFQNLQWEAPDRRMAEKYRAGMVVQFNQNAEGIKRGSLLRVLGHDDRGAVKVLGPDGRESTLALQNAARFQVFQERPIMLARGDRIRITHGGKTADGRRLNNGNVFTIRKIGADGKITLNTGAVIDAHKGFHFTYGYCQTSHSVQSKTVRDVLVAQSADSFLAGSKEQLYVSVSRGQRSIRIYTDSLRELQQAVGNSSIRKSGIELAGLTNREVSSFMSEELGGRKWRDLIVSRREGPVKTHLQNLLRDRRQDPNRKTDTVDFRQYIIMRRAMAGADGKSRSRGRGDSKVELPGGLSASVGGKNQKKPAISIAPKAAISQTRQQRLAKRFEAGVEHFKRVTGKIKTAVRSVKKTERAKDWLQEKATQLARHRVKGNKPEKETTVRKKKIQQAPPPPAPRRGR